MRRLKKVKNLSWRENGAVVISFPIVEILISNQSPMQYMNDINVLS